MVEDNTNVKGNKTPLFVLANVYIHVYLREWCREN